MKNSPATHFTLFTTALGTCGLAWNDTGIVRSSLPDPDLAHLRAHLCGGDATESSEFPAFVRQTIEQIQLLLAGEVADLSTVPLDFSEVAPFTQRIYDLVRAIPRGATLSYGEVAAKLGEPGAARAVGQAMATNPFPPIVPCHRVLAANGKPGGFSAPGGTLTKLKLLQLEGALEDDLFGW